VTTALTVTGSHRTHRLPRSVYTLSAGVVFDLSADSFLLFTLLWIAGPQGWTGFQTAAIVIALRVPALFGGWIGGRAIDRFGPRPLMLSQAAVRIACLIALTICSWSGRYPLVVVLVLGGLSGAVVPISYAGARTLVPRLLPAKMLIRANSLLAVGDQAALVVGAAFVGPVLAAIGVGPALLAPVAMLVVAALFYLTLPPGNSADQDALASAETAAAAPSKTRSPWRLRPVLGLVTLSAFYYFAYGPVEPVLPDFTRYHLHAGTGAYSLLWVAFGLGALVGLSQTARLNRYRPGVVNAAGTALWGLVTLPLVFCGSIVPAMIVMGVSGIVWGPYLAVEATALQRWTPPSLHGRLFGTQHAILAVASPLGAAAGSVALLALPSTEIITVAILACIVAGLAALTTRSIRRPTGQHLDGAESL
jgi:predicted MFS family arabinose efflux permease